jgi:hypothetical protein
MVHFNFLFLFVRSFGKLAHLCFSYMKDGLAGNKMNSLARSNASLYGNKDDLYDRLRRHAYQGKKSGKGNFQIREGIRLLFENVNFIFKGRAFIPSI